METKNLVICDEDVQYMQSLLAHMTAIRQPSLQVYICNGIDKVISLMESINIEYLFLSSKFTPERRNEVKSQYIFVLTESKEDSLQIQEIPMYKYQSIDAIKEIFFREISGGEQREYGGIKENLPVDIRLFGIYSPCDKRTATAYGLHLAKDMARQCNLLYISTQVHLQGNEFFAKEKEKSVLDLLYFYRQEHKNLREFLPTLVQNREGFDIILPVEVSEDIKEVPDEDWLGLIRLLTNESYYEAIILELGECTRGVHRILSLCSEIHIPCLPDAYGSACALQFEKEMTSLGSTEVLKRLSRKEIKM